MKMMKNLRNGGGASLLNRNSKSFEGIAIVRNCFRDHSGAGGESGSEQRLKGFAQAKTVTPFHASDQDSVVEKTIPDYRIRVNKAFTLAEVLITLAIIGIVAAMTIPTLVSNYQKKQTVVKLKQAYALLQQIMQFSVMENGSPSKWDYDLDNISFINKYFAPYVKIMEITDVYEITSLDGKVHGKNISQVAQLTNGNTLFYLPHINGTVIWLTLIVDLNGKSNPNIVGKDIFVFSFVNDKLTTYDQYWQMDGMSYSRNFLLIPGTSGQCNPKAAGGVIGAGSFCSRLIEMDGWEIKDDYPWD